MKLFFALLLSFSWMEVAHAKLLIVIDPGHGGSDTGAIYDDHKNIKHLFKVPGGKKTVTAEKDLTLMIARDLARELLIKGNSVILTRNEDKDMQLPDRTALANRLKANVFVSIHMNSSTEKNQKGGIETYILNHATDDSSKRLADLENKVLKESEAIEKTKSANVSLIMKDMILDNNLEPSRQLACAVQFRLTKNSVNRGVKQALFYVLLGADMPSILIEAGFMNSKPDRDRVLNTKSRLKLAAEIASAIDDYRLKKIPQHCHIVK